ncbi:hypothetical protein [Thermococcus sp.]|uniref:hypothetical protein n=1 Tax=Thermococcus sp. TaxID=35749 RepID=UPI00261292D1|nr:hypothetical protein [Thermococcus sp.]
MYIIVRKRGYTKAKTLRKNLKRKRSRRFSLMSFTPKSAKNEWDGKTENQQAEEVNVAKAESQAQRGA